MFGGGGDMFGGGGDFFGGGGGDDFGMDFFGNDGGAMYAYTDDFYDPYAYYYDDYEYIYVDDGAAIAYSSAAASVLVLGDGGNTITVASSDFINNGTITGGTGDDVITLTGAGAQGSIDLGAGTDSLQIANGGGSDIHFDGVETIIAGEGIDGLHIDTSGTGGTTIKYSATNKLGDSINLFTSGTDSLEFSRSAFSGDGNTNGACDAFQSGAGVTDSSNTDVYFVQDTDTKILYYDADANGAGVGIIAVELDTNIAIGDITFVA
jgi:hypothetical protein